MTDRLNDPNRWMLTLNWSWKDNSDGYKLENVLASGEVAVVTTEPVDWTTPFDILQENALYYLMQQLQRDLSNKVKGASID